MDVHRASSLISSIVAIPPTVFILVKLLPIKDPRQRYLYYIIGQCVLDCFYSTSNCLRTFDILQGYLLYLSRILMVYTCLLSTLIALSWKKLFIQLGEGHLLTAIAWIPVVPCTVLICLSFINSLLGISDPTVAFLLTSVEIYFGFITAAFLTELVLIPFCLYHVLQVPRESLSHATYKGWRKVAIGLILKMTMQLMLLAYLAVSLFYYRLSKDTQAYLDSAVTISLVIGMVYPGVDVLINTYMVSGLLLKRKEARAVTISPSLTHALK